MSAAAAKKKKGERRVAQEKQRRMEQALAQLPELTRNSFSRIFCPYFPWPARLVRSCWRCFSIDGGKKIAQHSERTPRAANLVTASERSRPVFSRVRSANAGPHSRGISASC